MPSVDAAIAQGSAAVQQLLALKNPSVDADLLQNSTVSGGFLSSGSFLPVSEATAQTSSVRTRRIPQAHAASCYGAEASQWNYTEAGITVAWVYTRINGWCGNGSTHVISSTGGWSFASWSQAPFCLGNQNEVSGWDVLYSEQHAMFAASEGVSYAFGCATYNGGHAPLRIRADGGWDTYDDWGF
jgi:hypothetical protein